MSVFFVYGTLMRGFRNQELHLPDHAVEKTVSGTLSINGYMVHFEHGFPGLFYNCESDNSENICVAGELVYVKSEYVEEITALCDGLEEYYGVNDPRNLYRKEAVVAYDSENTPVNCHTYICLLDSTKLSTRLTGSVVCWRTYMQANSLIAAATDWASEQSVS